MVENVTVSASEAVYMRKRSRTETFVVCSETVKYVHFVDVNFRDQKPKKNKKGATFFVRKSFCL